MVVGDVSGKTGSTIWGPGAVVADTQGHVVWEEEAWMDILHGSTDVLMSWKLQPLWKHAELELWQQHCKSTGTKWTRHRHSLITKELPQR